MNARIIFRKSCVCICEVRVGRKTVYETRAWGSEYNAAQDARSWATANGYSIK